MDLKFVKNEIYVIEASSFQLEYSKFIKPYCAAILNISQDHLDFHLSIEDYFLAKKKLFQPDMTTFAIVFSNDWGKKLVTDLEVDHVTVGFESSDFATFNTYEQNNSSTTGSLMIDDKKYDLSLIHI